MYTAAQLATLKAHAEYIGLAAAVRKLRAAEGDFKPSYRAALRAKRNDYRVMAYKKRAPQGQVAHRQSLVKTLHAKVSRKEDRKWKTFSTATQISQELRKAPHNIEVCLATVRRDLRALGLKCRVRAKVPSRRRRDIEQQRTFRARVRRLKIKGEEVLFSDEVIISCKENTGRYQWCKPGEEPFNRENKSRRNYPSLHIFAAVGENYKSKLVIIPRKIIGDDGPEAYNLNAAGYRRRCLSQVSAHMEANPHKWFLQDGARPHTARTTQDYFERKKWKLLQLCPYTPQWNPIENVWKKLHEMIGRECPLTLEELETAAKEAWDSEEMTDAINTLCKGWRSRLDNYKFERK